MNLPLPQTGAFFMLKYIAFFLLISLAFQVNAQKFLEKSKDANGINWILIDADGMFKVALFSEKTDQIKVTAKIEGEYAESTLVTLKEKNGALLVSSGFLPFFKKDNDKLAAHKLQSVALTVIVPEGLNVSVTSDIASLKAMGTFEFLTVALDEGRCELLNFLGDADIKTKKGDIYVEVIKNNVSVTGFTKYGTLLNELPNGHTYIVEAHTLYGDITLLQTH